MSNIAIRVENLGKKYHIGAYRGSHKPIATYKTLQEAIVRGVRSPFERASKLLRGHAYGAADMDETIWALREVSFEVRRGEVIGIIGRNGAGKSTLLKILSRITAFSEGRVEIHGRVGSLLEVGTGFHPELTGRENIFLNGAILGMRKREIVSKFDEIVAFAEIAKFIDTPVKFYSSGMYIRLAFAVAAYLDPEILLVDEVLAVGDTAFQKKCLGKMSDVARGGRTVLFVSHNMAAVSSLCSKALILDKGRMLGSTVEVDDAIQTYISQVSLEASVDLRERKDRTGRGRVRMVRFAMYDHHGKEIDILLSGQYVELRIYYECADDHVPENISVGVGVKSYIGQFLSLLSNEMVRESFPSIQQRGYWSIVIEKLPIAPMQLCLNLIVRQNGEIEDYVINAVTVRVEKGDFYGTGIVTDQTHGGFLIEQRWRDYSLDQALKGN